MLIIFFLLIIQYYHLFCCSGCFNLGHWRLFPVPSYDLFICPTPFNFIFLNFFFPSLSFSLSFCISLCVYIPYFLVPQYIHHIFSLTQPWNHPVLQEAQVSFIGEWRKLPSGPRCADCSCGIIASSLKSDFQDERLKNFYVVMIQKKLIV